MESGYYPPGAEFDSRAPWNEKEIPEIEKEITISLTISKDLTITVPEDYDLNEIKNEIKDYYYLPHTVINDLKFLLKDNPQAKTLLNDLEGWVEDDFEINY